MCATRKCRESAVADNLAGHTLLQFLGSVPQHVQIGVAMDVHKSRRNRETRAVENLRILWRGYPETHVEYPLTIKKYISRVGVRSRAIHNQAISKK
jgi:hypothetical protein